MSGTSSPFMFPPVKDPRGASSWPPHEETEQLGDNPTKVTEIKIVSLPQTVWSQTHI